KSGSCDFDDIPVALIKTVAQEISPVLAHIANMMFEMGNYPDILKKAKIKAIFEKGNEKEMANYMHVKQ
ncbi:hypothetical protein HHI36_001190, partial [Cryptolaemus montrouzieri]